MQETVEIVIEPSAAFTIQQRLLINANTEDQLPPFTMSGHTLDEIVFNILEADLDNTIEIPSKLGTSVSYGRDCIEMYRPEDIAWVEREFINKFTNNELVVLDAVCKWTFRNTGDLMRSAVGIVGAALSSHVAIPTRDQPIEAIESGADIFDNLMAEPVWTIRRLIQTATSSGAIDAKIPLKTLAEVFSYLANVSKKNNAQVNEQEKARLSKLIMSVNSNSQLSEASMSQEDFAVSRLIQMTKSVAQYKREEGFCRLRSFLTNGSMVAGIIRIKSLKNTHLSRLCADTLDLLHSIDRLLNSNCVAANGLLDRMWRGELVYDEVIAMARHQHRIMAVEFTGVITMFAYLLKQASLTLREDRDVNSAIRRLLNYSGISEQYSSEIVSKQFRNT